MKFEEDLAIDNSAKKQAELDKVYKEKSELEKEKTKYVNLEKDFDEFKEEKKSVQAQLATIQEELEKVKQWRDISQKFEKIQN